MDIQPDFLPTTNSGEIAFEVEKEPSVPGRVEVSGHIIYNNVGVALTRKKHQLKATSKQLWFLQRIVGTNTGVSIPLGWPEGMIFPSTFYKTTRDGSVMGAIPAPLLSTNIGKYGFASIPEHARSRLTSCLSSTSTDPCYIAMTYDTLVNLATNHNHTGTVYFCIHCVQNKAFFRERWRWSAALYHPGAVIAAF